MADETHFGAGDETVFTVGHGTRSVAELIEILREAGVEILADVRRFPGSRRNPQFAREALAASLADSGIQYRWEGESLGGRRSSGASPTRHAALRNAAFRSFADYMDTDEFSVALGGLEELARVRTVAIMCAETVWWRCHRRHIADALVLHGFRVVHLMGPGQSQPYRTHPAMRSDERNRPVYDVGETPTLLDEE